MADGHDIHNDAAQEDGKLRLHLHEEKYEGARIKVIGADGTLLKVVAAGSVAAV